MPSWELRTRCTGVRRPSAEVRTYRCTLGSLIFPCHTVLPTLPMRWGRVQLPVRPGASHGCGVFILQKGIPLSQGKDSGPRAHLRGGFEPVGGAKIYTLRSHSMTRAKICQLATGHTNRRAGFHGQPTHGPHAWRFSHAPHAWGALLASPMLRISSGGGPEAMWERARRFASPAHGGQCLSHVTRGPESLCL